MRSLRLFPALGVLALALAGCDDGDPILFPPAASLESSRTPESEGRVGDPLPRTPQVRVTDADGNPRPGVLVRFEVTAGGGTVAPSEATTDVRGVANVTRWELGTTPGPQRMQASFEGSEPVMFEVVAVPGPVAEVVFLRTPPEEAEVGESILEPVSFQLVDRFGNPTPGVGIAAIPAFQSGQVIVSGDRTDEDGRFEVHRWDLGTVPGTQSLSIRVGVSTSFPQGTELVGYEVEVSPGAPSAVLGVEGDAQVAEPGAEVGVPPAVRVEDRFGNPTPGIEVAFVVTQGGGSVSDGSVATDAEGLARTGGWTLGAAAGPNALEARVGGVDALVVLAEAADGGARSLAVADPPAPQGPAGYPIPEPPSVLVTDADGQPLPGAMVTFEAVEAGSGVLPSASFADGSGVARVEQWRLTAEPGVNRLRVGTAGADPIEITTDGIRVFVVEMEGVHLNQGNQFFGSELPAISGRTGVLRMFATANLDDPVSPRARVTLFHGETVVLEEVIQRIPPGGLGVIEGLPEEVDALDPTLSWNLVVPGELVRSGLSVRVELDPDGELDVPDRSELVFPAPDATFPIQVNPLPEFRATFIPVHALDINTTGRVTASNVESYASESLRMFPIGDYDLAVRETFTSDASPMSGSDAVDGWSRLLSQIQTLRLSEAPDRYYHGIVRRTTGSIAGIAFVPPNPSSALRSAVSHDALPAAVFTIAHEFGHNFGRRHAPCGNPANVDIFYPHPGAVLGHPGYDPGTSTFLAAADTRDVMSYCGPRWTSDYTFAGVFQFRSASFMGAPPFAAAAPLVRGPGVVLAGRWDAGRGPELYPVISLEGHASPSPERPDAWVIGLAEDGRVLFRVGVEAGEVPDVEDPSFRQFVHFHAMHPAAQELLHEVVLESPEGDVRWGGGNSGGAGGSGAAGSGGGGVGSGGGGSGSGGGGAGSGGGGAGSGGTSQVGPQDARLSLSPSAEPGAVELRWDREAYPMVVVRNADGLIIAMGTSGRLRLPSAQTRGELEVRLSDGVRTRVEGVGGR